MYLQDLIEGETTARPWDTHEFASEDERLAWMKRYYKALNTREDHMLGIWNKLHTDNILMTELGRNVNCPAGWSPVNVNYDNYTNVFIADKYKNLLPKVTQMLTKIKAIRQTREQLQSELRAINKQRREALGTGSYAKALAAQNWPAPTGNIPAKIIVGSKVWFANPYFNQPVKGSQYCGNPLRYPELSKQMRIIFVQLSDLLKRHLQPPFTQFYAARYEPGNNQAVNFVAISGRGKVIWRKYDPCSGGGANWCYVNGNKINTSMLIGNDEDEADRLFVRLLNTP